LQHFASLILQQLWQLLAKGGKLLYVTCSIFNEENQQQIDQFLQKHADATQLPLLLTNSLLTNYIDNNIKTDYVQTQSSGQQHHIQLVPCQQHDGLFYALLQKSA
jgi:16S rRNA (cytosine967-C5)-methyltransferase